MGQPVIINSRKYIGTAYLSSFLQIPQATLNAFCQHFTATADHSYTSSVEQYPNMDIMMDASAFAEFAKDKPIAITDFEAVMVLLGEIDVLSSELPWSECNEWVTV